MESWPDCLTNPFDRWEAKENWGQCPATETWIKK